MSGKKLTFSPKPTAKAIDDWITTESEVPQSLPVQVNDMPPSSAVFAEPDVKIEPVMPKVEKSLKVDPAPPASGKMVRFTVDLNVDLHTRIKLACATKRKRMADEVRRVLDEEFPEA